MSSVLDAEMCSLQQLRFRTTADYTDSRFTNNEKTLNEISIMVKSHPIIATYDQFNPKLR